MSTILSAGKAEVSRLKLLPVEQGKTDVRCLCIHTSFYCVGYTYVHAHMHGHIVSGSVKYTEEIK